MFFFFFKQKTAYEMRISDWSSDVCSSDLGIDRNNFYPIRITIAHRFSATNQPHIDRLGRAGGKDKPPLAAQKLKHLAPRHLNASSRHPAEPMRTMGIGELIAQPGSHCRE